MSETVVYTIYLLLFGTKILIPSLGAVSMALLIAVNAVILTTSPKSRKIALFSTFILPGEIYSIANILIYVLVSGIRGKLLIKRIDRRLWIVFASILLVSLISALEYGTYINIIVESLYLLLICFSYSLFQGKVSKEEIITLITNFVYIETILTFLIIIKNKSIIPGDLFLGSMNSAHYFGNWLIVCFFTLYYINYTKAIKSFKGFVRDHLRVCVCILFMTIMASALSLVACALIAVLVFKVMNHRNLKHNDFFLFIVLSYLFVFIFVLVFNSSFVHGLIDKYVPDMGNYLYTVGWNGKFNFIRGTMLEELHGIRMLLGYGLGQYGSRVSNLFAYDSMWRGNNSINNIISTLFNSHSIPQYTKYVSYYNNDFVTGIRWRSAVLSYPFNNFISLIGETGVIGMLLFALIANRVVRQSKVRIIAYYFFIACFFDMYFDNYPCIGIVIFMLVNTFTISSPEQISTNEGRLRINTKKKLSR